MRVARGLDMPALGSARGRVRKAGCCRHGGRRAAPKLRECRSDLLSRPANLPCRSVVVQLLAATGVGLEPSGGGCGTRPTQTAFGTRPDTGVGAPVAAAFNFPRGHSDRRGVHPHYGCCTHAGSSAGSLPLSLSPWSSARTASGPDRQAKGSDGPTCVESHRARRGRTPTEDRSL